MNIEDTIKPKSDQLNADDLIAGPMVVEIESIHVRGGDQPVVVALKNGLRPYLPCKSMRRVMIMAWGKNSHEWGGRMMELYCDPAVKFGGSAVGGIRIGKMSNIEKSITMMLTVSRGKRTGYTVAPLKASSAGPNVAHVISVIDAAHDKESLAKAADMAAQLPDADKPATRAAYQAAKTRIGGNQ